MENGEGLAQVFPPLKGSSAVQAAIPDTVIHVVLAGAKIATTQSKPTGFAMPAFDWKLDDKEVADLVNYIRNAWGNHASLRARMPFPRCGETSKMAAGDLLMNVITSFGLWSRTWWRGFE